MLPAVKKRRTRRPDNGSYWTSFSDMLSSVLLVIMLALVFSIYQYYSQLDIKTKELEAQKSELDRTLIILSAQQQELDNARIVLVGKEDELAAIQIHLAVVDDTTDEQGTHSSSPIQEEGSSDGASIANAMLGFYETTVVFATTPREGRGPAARARDTDRVHAARREAG